MALVSGPTIGTAIAEPQNDLHQLVHSVSDNRQLISEVFYRVLNRPASEKEIEIASNIFDRIREDNELLKKQLEKKEAWWVGERERREAERIQQLAEATKQMEAREIEIKPERERLEKERLARIKAAEEKRDTYQKELPEKFASYLDKNQSGVDWHPIAFSSANSTNKATFSMLPDRSIRVDGNKQKGTYNLSTKTSLGEITGVRLEALPIAEIAGGGPGLASGGNFVLTELELFVGPLDKPKQMKQVKFKSGVTDFDQGGFSAAALIDGKNRDQGGWAVSGATGVEHWAVLRLEKPLMIEKGWGLEFRLHQYHNAEDHRLGHFRISVTSDESEIPLGLSESLSALQKTSAPAQKKEEKEAGLSTLRPSTKGVGKSKGRSPPPRLQCQRMNRWLSGRNGSKSSENPPPMIPLWYDCVTTPYKANSSLSSFASLPLKI